MGWLSGWNYAVEVTVSNSSSSDLSDVQVLIQLDSNFPGWSDVNSDGSDIRITESDGTTTLPLWIEKFDTTNKVAVIWTKISSIAANGSVTLYLYYGNSSATAVSDGASVFDFFDGFESWSGWTTYNTGVVSQSSDYTYTGSYSLKKDTYGDPNGGYKSLGFTLNYDFILEAWIDRTNLSGANADRIGVIDSSGNGYGIEVGHGTDLSVVVDKRTSYNATNVGSSATGSGDITNTWYLAKMIWKTTGDIEVCVLKDYGDVFASTSVTGETTYTSFANVYVFGGYTYYVDNLRIRKAGSDDLSASVGTTALTDSSTSTTTATSTTTTTSSTTGWLSGWSYAVKVTVSNSLSTELTDFQVRIDLDSTFPGWSDVNSDGSDIRITADDGTTLLPIWIENFDTTNKVATIWTKVSSIPAATTDSSGNTVDGTVTLYLYYGNSSATSASDGDNVFDLFDDFDGSSLDTNKWSTRTWQRYTTYSGTTNVSLANSVLTLTTETGGTAGYALILDSVTTFSVPIIMGFKMKTPNWGGTGTAGYYRSVQFGLEKFTSTSGNALSFDDNVHFSISEGGRKLHAYGTTSANDLTFDPTAMFKIEITALSGTGKCSVNDGAYTDSVSGTGTVYTSIPVEVFLNSWYSGHTSEADIDWIYVRKYASTEPSVSVGTTVINAPPHQVCTDSTTIGESIINNIQRFINESSSLTEKNILTILKLLSSDVSLTETYVLYVGAYRIFGDKISEIEKIQNNFLRVLTDSSSLSDNTPIGPERVNKDDVSESDSRFINPLKDESDSVTMNEFLLKGVRLVQKNVETIADIFTKMPIIMNKDGFTVSDTEKLYRLYIEPAFTESISLTEKLLEYIMKKIEDELTLVENKNISPERFIKDVVDLLDKIIPKQSKILSAFEESLSLLEKNEVMGEIVGKDEIQLLEKKILNMERLFASLLDLREKCLKFINMSVTDITLKNTQRGVYFNGINSYGVLSDASALSVTNLTMELEFVPSKENIFGYIVQRASGVWGVYVYDGKIVYYVSSTNNGGNWVAVSEDCNVGKLYHRVVVYDGTNLTVYSPSGQVGQVSNSGDLNTNTSVPLHIGTYDGSSYFWNGVLYRLKIWGSALANVDDIFSGEVSTTPLLWLDNDSIDWDNKIWKDKSGNGNDISLKNVGLVANEYTKGCITSKEDSITNTDKFLENFIKMLKDSIFLNLDVWNKLATHNAGDITQIIEEALQFLIEYKTLIENMSISDSILQKVGKMILDVPIVVEKLQKLVDSNMIDEEVIKDYIANVKTILNLLKDVTTLSDKGMKMPIPGIVDSISTEDSSWREMSLLKSEDLEIYDSHLKTAILRNLGDFIKLADFERNPKLTYEVLEDVMVIKERVKHLSQRVLQDDVKDTDVIKFGILRNLNDLVDILDKLPILPIKEAEDALLLEDIIEQATRIVEMLIFLRSRIISGSLKGEVIPVIKLKSRVQL